ncbi:carboxypeptidase C prc1 [Linnemannia gamsii]|uniref:Carboxypeptidase C prc1 n=1 Tax=Linnemannia gamsii TaxID=64522 RepID=A0ABQ7JQ39_9FUNG|nr:carboxypeptidase C prc1 [Linnemannia gamsii]
MTITTTATASSSGVLTLVQSGSRTACLSPEPNKGATADPDHDAIWYQRPPYPAALEARKDHILLAAEIEDLMVMLEDHCHQLGLDPANITQLMILPCTAPITLTSRQTLFRACDDLYQDIVRRQERVERWVSMITTIAENIREPPELYLESNMPTMSRARILQLERTYRILEKEWMERLQRFQSTVGMLRVRWDQCAYLPTDDYDNALSRLFDHAEVLGATSEFSYLRIEAPLCLSKDCLSSLSGKLASLDQNYYTRQSRIRAMEHVLGLIYQDLNTPLTRRVTFRNEATVKYAAELGRELKSLQLELAARKLYHSGERWSALTLVWDQCFVGDLERQRFREAIEHEDVTYMEKMERLQAEIEGCRTRYSKSGPVYKLMMTRSSHIERMIAFEQTASDPKRLFQSSFQLVEEEKFRRRAYPTLLKLESTLLNAIIKFEQEHEQSFMYEGLPYLETLQKEIENRHVNETVFAKFTPVIAAPTRSQTVQIMGRAISPIPAPQATSTPSSRVAVTTTSPQQSRQSLMASTRSLEASRRSNTLPISRSTSPGSPLDLLSKEKERGSRGVNANAEQENNPIGPSASSTFSSHRRETSSASTVSVSSSHSLRSKSSHSSLSQGSLPASASASASTSPMTDVAIAAAAAVGPAVGGGTAASYFGPISTSSMTATLSPSSSTSSLVSVGAGVSPLGTPSPKHETAAAAASAVGSMGSAKSQRFERLSLPNSFKTPPTSPAPSQQQQPSFTGPRTLTLRPQANAGRIRPSIN